MSKIMYEFKTETIEIGELEIGDPELDTKISKYEINGWVSENIDADNTVWTAGPPHEMLIFMDVRFYREKSYRK